jgi:hypothetical protein
MTETDHALLSETPVVAAYISARARARDELLAQWPHGQQRTALSGNCAATRHVDGGDAAPWQVGVYSSGPQRSLHVHGPPLTVGPLSLSQLPVTLSLGQLHPLPAGSVQVR